jgi:hypothetical protein
MAVPYTFANATSAIPLSQLDSNFATAVTIGNVAVQLGNTATTLGNVTMANVTITSVSTPITGAQGGTGLSSYTANAVVYAPTTSTLATGSALTFNGSTATPIVTITKGTPATFSGLNFVYGSATSSVLVNDSTGEMQYASGTSSSGYFQTFKNNGTEGMRLDSSGRLLVGTTTNVNSANKLVVRGSTDAVPLAQFYQDVNQQPSSAGTTTIRASANTNTSNDSTLLWLENLNPFGASSMASTGIKITGNTYAAAQTIFGVDAGYGGVTINRPRTDGTLIDFLRNGTSQGSITVSGSTVSYNSFAGSHWSQWIEGRGYAPLTLRGTVLSTIDEMCVWKSLSWSEEYESQDTTNDLIAATTIGQEGNTALSTKKLMVKAKPYLGNEPIGAIIIEDGIEKVVIDDGNERLPKVKVSNVVGDKRVYGVFMDYDKVQDIHVTAIGAFVVRIASGVTVNAGDLLESNGDGCAKVQADDIIKSSTIAKVTTNIVSDTYPDGSFTVPCVLYCG